MNRTIEKKVDSEYFASILSGSKTFELRLADWECSEGDKLLLREVDSAGNYTDRTVTKIVGYVLKTKNLDLFPLEEVEQYGYQVISLLDEVKA